MTQSPLDSPAAATAAKSLQSYPTLCDPRDGSPPGSPIPGILQARTLEWVAISSSNAWKWKVRVKSPSHVWLLAAPWTAAYQAPPSMGFSRQEYWSGVPLPSPIRQSYPTAKIRESLSQRGRIFPLSQTDLISDVRFCSAHVRSYYLYLRQPFLTLTSNSGHHSKSQFKYGLPSRFLTLHHFLLNLVILIY